MIVDKEWSNYEQKLRDQLEPEPLANQEIDQLNEPN